MKKPQPSSFGHWETLALRSKLGEIKEKIDAMELSYFDPFTYTNKRSKRILLHLQIRFSEIELELQKRYA